MRHNRRTKRFGRNPKERRAMLENLVTSLLHHQQITTTLEKAKETKRLADRVITLGKDDSLHSRRQVFSYLQDHELTSKIFKDVAPRFKNRQGGYTRILHLQNRKGDNAAMALLELTEKEIKIKAAPKKKKERTGHAHDHDHDHKDHKHGEEKGKPEAKAKPDAPTHPKHAEPKHEKPNKGGFFKNLGKFFRNKGGS